MAREFGIYKTLKAYAAGKFSKYDAMDKLGIHSVAEFLNLLAEYELTPTEAVSLQSSPGEPPLAEFFTHG